MEWLSIKHLSDWESALPILITFYLAFTLALTLISALRMVIINRRAVDKKAGVERLNQLLSEKRLKKVPIYSMQEMKQKKVYKYAKLTVFPNDSGEKRRYVLICPGGGYARCLVDSEGYPLAAKYNELGYTAFVLEYRVGRHCSTHAPMHDLARAIKHIEEHADEYNVLTEDYMIVGLSTGGNLAAVFGTEKYGYARYGATKPGQLTLGYPWTNLNHWFEHPYWNIWTGILGVWLCERANIFMFHQHMNHENRNSLSPQKWITPSYPPTYIFSGGDDIFVPASAHADMMTRAFQDNHVAYWYRFYRRLPHGVGVAAGTEAAGWIDESVKFWETIEKK